MPFGTPLHGHERIQSFSHHVGELECSQQYKVAKLFEHNCIEYVPVQHWDDGSRTGGYWLIHPIPGYNKREYHVEACGDGEFRCTCQFYKTWSKNAEPKNCSHIGAIYEFLKRKNMARRDERVSAGIQLVLSEVSL